MKTKKRAAVVEVSEPDMRTLPFDSIRHPLLHEVWMTLEKNNPGKTRQWIFENCHGEVITKKSPFGGTLQRNMPRTGRMPVEFIMAEYIDKEETELKKFLDDVYHIEEINAENIELQEAVDAVSSMQGIPEAGLIAKRLSEDIEYLRKNYEKIGRFAIIPNRKKPYEHIIFMTFESFSKEFLKLAIWTLKRREIPTFEFFYTSYIRLIREIVHITPWIINSCNEQRDRLTSPIGITPIQTETHNPDTNTDSIGAKQKFICPQSIGYAFLAVYRYAQDFERSHHELSYNDVNRGERTICGAEAGWEKTHAAPKFDYDKLRPQVICYVKKNKKDPCRSIDRAAKELAKFKAFPCSKIIKAKFKEELELLRTPKKIKI